MAAAPPPPANLPFILFLCHPLTGHFTPLLKIATALHTRGWPLSFLSSTFFRPRILASNLDFLPLTGAADIADPELFDRASPLCFPTTQDDPTLAVKSITDTRHQAIHALPDMWSSVKAALVTLTARDPTRQILIVVEAFFYGALPLKLGAPLPEEISRAPKTVCISITAPAIRSIDLPPFGQPGYFDTSAAGRQRNAAEWDRWIAHAAPVTALLARKLAEAGCVVPLPDGGVFMAGGNYVVHDRVLQIGLPSFEYPQSGGDDSGPPPFRIAGIIPAGSGTNHALRLL